MKSYETTKDYDELWNLLISGHEIVVMTKYGVDLARYINTFGAERFDLGYPIVFFKAGKSIFKSVCEDYRLEYIVPNKELYFEP